MNNGDRVSQLATALLQARQTRKRLSLQDGLNGEPIFEPSLEEVYAVQARVMEQLGPIGGFKVGRSSPDAATTVAPIAQSMIRQSGATYTTDEMLSCGIELEIGFILNRLPPSPDSPDFEARLRECVSPCAAIELVDGRVENFSNAPPLIKLADNQVGAGAVMASLIPDWRPEALCSPEINLTFNGRTIVQGKKTVPGGSAFGSLMAFLRAADRHRHSIKAGQLVITGSLSGIDFVAPDTLVEGQIEGLGPVSVRFASADPTL